MQDGLVLIWLHFRDERCKTNKQTNKQTNKPSMLFCHLGPAVYLFVCVCVRERQRVSRGRTERERMTQNLKRTAGSELSGLSPMQGSNP